MHSLPGRSNAGHIGYLRIAGVLAGLAILVLAGWYAEELFEPVLGVLEFMEDHTRQHPVIVYGGFIVLYALLVASGIPLATPLAIASGLLFGLVAGAAASLAGCVIGSFITFALASRLSEYRADRIRNNRHVRQVLEEVESDESLYLILLRIMPVLPIVIVNVSLALLAITPARFLATTTIGLIPSMTVYAAVGTSLGSVVEAGDVPMSELVTDPAVWMPLGGLTLLIATGLIIRAGKRKS